jgi:galactose mutarotase-like enzyme
MEIVPYLGLNVRRWQVGSSTFLALPEAGARLMHWHVTHADGSVRDVIHWPELKEVKEFHRIRGGNPILFPFNARVFDQGKIHQWRDPEGQSRPMAMHGYARQGTFKLTRCDARGFAAVLVPDDEARAAYPYDYEFTVTYRFESLGLACELSLKNLGTQPIPWSAGHHFYFTVPWTEGAQRADYGIEIPATKVYKQNATGGLEPGPKLPQATSLGNPDLVDTIHCGLTGNTVRFGPLGQPGEVAIKLSTAKVPTPEAAVVTWTQDDASPFYCVEPWMGPPNAPEHRMGLHWVPPHQTQTFVVEVLAK